MFFIAFAIVFATMYVVDAWVYLRGHNTFFFVHKTEEEKRIREAVIQKLEREAKGL